MNKFMLLFLLTFAAQAAGRRLSGLANPFECFGHRLSQNEVGQRGEAICKADRNKGVRLEFGLEPDKIVLYSVDLDTNKDTKLKQWKFDRKGQFVKLNKFGVLEVVNNNDRVVFELGCVDQDKRVDKAALVMTTNGPVLEVDGDVVWEYNVRKGKEFEYCD